MVLNTNKTNHLLIATPQKLKHMNQPTFILFLNSNHIEEANPMKHSWCQDRQSPRLAQVHRILNWEAELQNLFT